MPDFQKYLVAVDTNARNVHIYLDGYKPQSGHRTVGEFEADVLAGVVKDEPDFSSPNNNVMIGKARQILLDLGIDDQSNYVYEDKASHAPRGDSYTLSPIDRDRAIKDGEDPADKQTKISEAVDKAASKYEEEAAQTGESLNDPGPEGE